MNAATPVSGRAILLLPPALRNQIAAGEVVERPASVLKELVENSLDAGATEISITLENGGQTLLAVRDNGRGIPAAELELAVTRHATSKVASFADLLHVTSYGFRGEALPSIGSVADMLLESAFCPQKRGCAEGAFIRIRHGEIAASGPSSLPYGTLVEVRDLFANVPARLKFLKSPSTELKRCQETLIRLALARPDTGFSLSVSGAGKPQERMRIEAGLSLPERLSRIWPHQLVESLHPFDAERSGMRARGLVSPAQQAQTRGDRMLTYVNNRPVQNRLLLQALRQAFKGRLTSREYPQAVLFLDMDPQEVDVNVHPAKSEVRFRDERAVFGAVLYALEKALSGPSANVFAPLDPAVETFPASGKQDPVPGKAPEQAGLLLPPVARTSRPAGFWGSIDAPRLVDRIEREYEAPVEQRVSALHEEVSAYGSVPDSAQTGGGRIGAGDIVEPPESEPSQAQCGYPVSVGGFVCLGQAAAAYLILVRGDALFLLDQHAAHERVLLHAVKSQNMSAHSQLLMIPAELSLHAAETARLEELFGQLADLGYSLSITPAGLSVSGVPPLLGRAGGLELLRNILSERVDGAEELLHRMACQAAIKAGQVLTADEAAGLLRQWLATPDRAFCPHGRPAVLCFDQAALEKMFKRSR